MAHLQASPDLCNKRAEQYCACSPLFPWPTAAAKTLADKQPVAPENHLLACGTWRLFLLSMVTISMFGKALLSFMAPAAVNWV